MQADISALEAKAGHIRRNVLEMIAGAKKGHIGGAFSCVDILVALFHGGVLRVDPANPAWPGRDRFILSKGHAATALYCVLADLGFFPQAELSAYGSPGCLLGGHPSRAVPGVEASTGSLGHGLGLCAGLALSAALDGADRLQVALLGDGECCEGSVWEAAMFASRQGLTRLVAVVDANGICATDHLSACADPFSLADKFAAFGFEVRPVDGHDIAAILAALADARARTGPPLCLVAATVKGKGVSFMENDPHWHHGVPKGDKLEAARAELARQGGVQ